MKRARRIARLTRQLVRAQTALGEAVSEVAVAAARRDRVRLRIAVRRIDEAMTLAAAAQRSLFRLQAEEEQGLRSLDAALRTDAPAKPSVPKPLPDEG